MKKVIATAQFVDESGKGYTINIIERYIHASTLNQPLKKAALPVDYELDDGTELDYISKDELVIRETSTRLHPKAR